MMVDVQETQRSWAVRGRNLQLSYGSGRTLVSVLDGLNFSVPAGSIYALLGPSGCGKTTLLRCVLGRLQAKGELSVLGKKPGAPCHGVPGVLVGYMPQEVALAPSFTILETMQYFGMLHGMSGVEIKQRAEFLLRLLDLPRQDRLISALSGGQQRRVSFAVALLQRPPLVILDEPTVGVDPVLRARIWLHLKELVADGRTTVIVTTHYIEEARQANQVAMMRDGRLLAEAPPSDLVQSYNLDTLEAVFLRLCERSDSCVDSTPDAPQRHIQATLDEESCVASVDTDTDNGITAKPHQHLGKKNPWIRGFSCVSIMAMVWKNLIIRKRMPMFLLFEFFLPSLEIALFCLAIGRAPTGLTVDVVNEDLGLPFGIRLSQPYVDCLAAQKHVVVSDRSNSSIDDALRAVQFGHSWGYLHFAEDFSTAFLNRTESPYTASNETIANASIHVRLDMSDQQIALVIQEDIAVAFQCFERRLLEKYAPLLHPSETVNPHAVSSPIEMGPPVYGELNPRFTDFVAPGMIVAVAYAMSIGLTALSVIIERKQGLLDRTRAAGASDLEILSALALTQLGVLIVQMILMVVIAVEGFKVRSHGSLPLLYLIVVLQGLAGMAYGLLLSALCSDETSAVVVAMGSLFPTLLLSGILWPLEAMPQWLRYISYCLPNTYAAMAVRDVMGRGWSPSHFDVWLGLVISLAWLIFYFVVSLFTLKRRT